MKLKCVLLSLATMAGAPIDATEVHQASGLKVGEVTPDSAIVWTRLTEKATRNPADGPTVSIKYVDGKHNPARREGKVEDIIFSDNATVDELRQAVPGAPGETRVLYRPEGQADWIATKWGAVGNERDFTRQIPLHGLEPHTRYELKVEGRGTPDSEPSSRLSGKLRTAPLPNKPARVVFTVSTGQGEDDQDRPDGFQIYPSMLDLAPDFFVHTGDILYYDRLAKTLPLARYHWQRMFSWPTNLDFHRVVPSYFEKDDHDTWVDDCWPTMKKDYMHEFTFAQGQAVFLEQVPMSDSTFRTFRWGRDLQIWLVEGRDFRSPNVAPDGPAKTIWGSKQKEWFKSTVQQSDATFRVLISPTPLVGPDRSKKSDNHANDAFAHEGNELREFIGEQENMIIVCGDRHWQYMSVDPKTGVREYCCGPASDLHAGGWSEEDYVEQYHRFLRVNGGFLSVTAERVKGRPTLTVQFHDVHGKPLHSDMISSN